jgi:uncharacterized membrane protein
MFLKLYFVALTIFLGIDIIWLTVIAKNLYSKQIGFLLAKNFNLAAASIFYLIFIAGLVIFVIVPSLEKKTANSRRCNGSFFWFSYLFYL